MNKLKLINEDKQCPNCKTYGLRIGNNDIKYLDCDWECKFCGAKYNEC